MSYCRTHNKNNCIECAIENQTKTIVRAIKELQQPELPPSGWQKLKHSIGLLFSRRARKAT